MKKMILGLTALALAGATVPAARANDCGWSTAAKVFTGIFAGAAVASAFVPQPVYCAPAYAYPAPAPAVSYGYYPAPAVYAPAPVVVVRPPILVPPPFCSRPVVVAPRCVVARPVVVAYGGHWNHHRPVCR